MRPAPFRTPPENRGGLCCRCGYKLAETVCVKRSYALRHKETGLALPTGFSLVGRVARKVAAGVLLLLGLFPALYAQAPSLHIDPSAIRKDLFYNGATVRVEGIAPPATDIVVVIRGNQASELFNKKGRIGPIWLNTDRIHIANAPSIFLSYSSAPVNSILDASSIDTYELDESSLKQHLTCRCHCKCPTTGATQGQSIAECKGVEPDPQYAATIRDSFLNLKKQDGSYQFHPSTVQLAASPNGTHYSLQLSWPKGAGTGTYQVEVYACKNHSVVARAATPLSVVEAGLPLYLAGLAKSRPWVYGFVAVLVAVLAGFTIDGITSRLRRPVPRRAPQPSGAAAPAPGQLPQAGSHALEEKAEQEPVHHS
jgi:hypothetical protein